MAEGIRDVDFASARAGAVDEIEIIPHQDVEQAAQDLVRAAAEARSREFIEDSLGSGYDTEGNYRPTYMDTTTGDFYVSQNDGSFINTTTGQVVSRDPTAVDESQYQWIIDKFTYFHERWPAYPRTMADHCLTAKAAIQSGQMTPIVGVGETVANNWGGQASDDFREFFLDPFMVNAITNQQALLDELAVAMYAYEAVLRQARLDAREIANQTINVLESVDAYGGGGDAGLVLGVIGVAVAVVTTVATAGTGTALTLGLVGAGVSAAQVAVSAEQQVAGETTDQIMDKLREVLENLRNGMDAEEEAIAQSLEQTAGQVEGWLASDSPLEMGTILPNEPKEDGVTNVTGGGNPAPDEFRPRQ